MTNDRIQLLIEQATTDGNFDKELFAELVVGNCVAAVLELEIKLSSFISSAIETKMGFEQQHFNSEWYKENYLVPVEQE